MSLLGQAVELSSQFIDLILHVDVHLNHLMMVMGLWTYVVLFLIIFLETGLVVVPFLPGDSLLFATGALAAMDGSPLNIFALAGLLFIAAVLGDALNYKIGLRFGPKIFHSDSSLLLNKKHLLHTQKFYEVHGGKTIIIARFMPIVRTFAPFVAGIGRMRYTQFALYNIVGAFLWIFSFLFAGYFFGNMPVVKSHFHLIIIAIIIISILPGVIGFLNARRSNKEKTCPNREAIN